jgi:hypothetical protein
MRKIIFAAIALCFAGGTAQAQTWANPNYTGVPNGAYTSPYPPIDQPQYGIYGPNNGGYPSYAPAPLTAPPLPQVPDPSRNARSPYPWGVQR